MYLGFPILQEINLVRVAQDKHLQSPFASNSGHPSAAVHDFPPFTGPPQSMIDQDSQAAINFVQNKKRLPFPQAPNHPIRFATNQDVYPLLLHSGN